MTRPILIAAVLAGASYMLIMPLFRMGDQRDQSQDMIAVVNAEPSNALLWVQDNLPAPVASVLTQIAVYGSHQPVMFSRFWDYMDIPPAHGAWQFSTIHTRITRESRYTDIRASIHQQQSAQGVFGNVWCTAVRDAIVDWGKTGALVQFGIMGLIAGWTRKAYLVRGSLGSGLLYAVIAGWVAFSWSVSATTLAYYEMFMVGCVVLWVCGFRNLKV